MVRTCFYFDVLGFELEHLAVALDPATSNLFTPTLKEEGKHTSDTPGQYPYDRQHKRPVPLDKKNRAADTPHGRSVSLISRDIRTC